ncbi:Probable ABC transporter permease protein HI_1471 [Peptoniphilus harei]|uniref:FecCD family ABC transporter permease n=1 Tax=Peptoniphilus harei TaxID=54005 RepID=UPI000F6C9C66|nr:iron ABC transporter permease [Peptoniphilus harei]QQE46792.1 iron ABC transporter permease [Peptoniphilus harei]VEJ35128.1 Probable ABC transporter permease protein HI_1471 [Peptoniphilus harei]
MTKNFWTRDDGRLHPYVYFILIFFPLVCGLLGLSMGRMDIKISEIILFFKNLIGGGQVDPLMESLIINIRLPRVLTALIVGGGLTAAGIAFQALFSNPLATPDILGVTSAASLGAVLGIILSLGTMGIQVLAMVFGLLSILITINLVKRDETSMIMLVLAGIIVSSLANALASLLKYTADPMDKLPQITYWLMGSFGRTSYKNLALAGPLILISIFVIYKMRWSLNLLSLSEDEARSLGINVKKTRLIFILAATLITASSVSICGQIGWIGLIIPHLVRLMVGSNNLYTLPLGISFGAGFMVLIEALSRTVSVIELPISILTAIIGAPIFIILMRRSGGIFK